MKHLKVLQITNRLPWPLNDGGNIATWNVTRYLHQFGHKIILASLNTKKHFVDPVTLPPFADIYTTNIDTSLNPIHALMALPGKVPYNIKRFKSRAFAKLLQRLIDQESPDIVQMEGIYMGLYLETIRKVSNVPIVLRAHNVEHRIWETLAENEYNKAKKPYLEHLAKGIKLFEEEHLHQFDGIIAITEDDRAWFGSKGYDKPLVSINAGAVHPDDPPPNKPARVRDLCFIGSLEWEPNVQGIRWFLKEVWPEISAKVPEARFHLAGKNPPAEMKQWRIPGLVFHGQVPDANAFMQEYGIMIVPLLSGSGMRLKVVEAMARGKCIISTAIGADGIKYVNGSNIFVHDDPAEWKQMIMNLMKDEEQVIRVGEQANRSALAHYNWETLVRAFESFYFRLL